MKSNVRWMVGLAFALAVTLAIAGLSRVPYAAADGDHALIRFSWRTPGAHVEECRTLSAEERERLPVHMRRDQVCERRMLPYRLLVRIDGATVYDDVVRPAGAREDRPLYVFRELPVGPGEYRVDVLWEQDRPSPPAAEPAADPADPAGGGRQHVSPGSGAPRPVPERLELAATLRLEPGDVALITYDVDRHVLVARGRGTVAGGMR
jgi:hypothetical protein